MSSFDSNYSLAVTIEQDCRQRIKVGYDLRLRSSIQAEYAWGGVFAKILQDSAITDCEHPLKPLESQEVFQSPQPYSSRVAGWSPRRSGAMELRFVRGRST